MSPHQRYRELVETGQLQPDAAQLAVVRAFEALHHALCEKPGLWQRLRGRNTGRPRGLYLWGGVGRGKTRLMDLFYDGLPLEAKRREHFHRFMGGVHEAMARLKGQPDPLKKLARDTARECRLLCLDEFQVWDIGDAMILSGLLQALFDQGVVLVTTSNTAPEELYRDGLQRALFLPAIERIQTDMRVLELAAGEDYRGRYLEQAQTYHVPVDEHSEALLATAFDRLAPGPAVGPERIRVNGRWIPLKKQADSVAWADFEALCDGPRGQADYLELARCYHCLLLSGIPSMSDGQNDRARRFIHLVDVLYDHNVTLIASAQAQPEALYQGQGLVREFQRTASRLREMQSRDWLRRRHLG